MRQFKSLFVLAACVSFAGATAVERWNSSSVDTTTHHTNTNSSSGKVAVGATSTGPSGIAVGAKASGANGIGVSGQSTGSNGTGVNGVGGIGVKGESNGGGYGVWGVSENGNGVWGTGGYAGTGGAGYEIGVWGLGIKGVYGYGSDTGVVGYAYQTGGDGVVGHGNVTGHGVVGISTDGNGVRAVSGNGTAINASANYLGIYAQGETGVYGYSSSVNPIGLEGYVYGSGYNLGGQSIGVRGTAYSGDYSYGVWGTGGGAQYENWSGWFDGDVYVGNSFVNPSDKQFKTNIKDYHGGLDKILALKIKSYDMKVDEFKGRVTLPSGPQIGVIAQEAELVFPEIVHSATSPVNLTLEERKKGVKKDPVKFKSVDYHSLIPVLVQAIQELQAEVDALKAAR